MRTPWCNIDTEVEGRNGPLLSKAKDKDHADFSLTLRAGSRAVGSCGRMQDRKQPVLDQLVAVGQVVGSGRFSDTGTHHTAGQALIGRHTNQYAQQRWLGGIGLGLCGC